MKLAASNLLNFPGVPNATPKKNTKPTTYRTAGVLQFPKELPKTGTCPTCQEPANKEDGVICKDCGAFLCAHPKCKCTCDRIYAIAERVTLEILRNPRQYGLQKVKV